MELVCTHPDPLDDPDNYLPQVHTWAENGTTIDISDPASARFNVTRLNSTAITLSFNVTEDHRDREILYTCFLTRNNPNRDREESEALVLDPPGEWTLFNINFKALIRPVYSGHVDNNYIGCILLADVLVHGHTYVLVCM